MHPKVNLDDGALPSDIAALEAAASKGAVERRAGYGQLQPCVDAAPRAQAHEPEASTAEATSCF
jgi:hypothetical protein